MIATDYPLLNVFWSMLMFFLFFAWIWILISVFADNFRRTDHSGLAKAGWTLLIVFLPFFGVLVYMIARPKMTEQDQQTLARMGASPQPSSGASPADELTKLAKLRDDGKITAEEYDKLKQRALASL